MNKKEQIIKTAIKLFVSQGFENTPTSQISKESDVATGTLFHHFKTKEELINDAYIYVKKSMASYIFRNLEKAKNTKDKIKQIWTDLIIWGFEKRDEALFLEKFYGSSYINNLTVEQMHAHFEPGAKIYEKAIKEKIIKNIPADLFSGITFGLFYAFSKEFNKQEKLNQNLLKKSFKIYWGALKKK